MTRDYATRLAAGLVTMRDIRAANSEAGHHWFERSTLRFFRSRISDHVYGAGYFVSSERGPDGIRRYSVRQAQPNGSIETIGEFGQYASGRAAHAAARKLAGMDK